MISLTHRSSIAMIVPSEVHPEGGLHRSRLHSIVYSPAPGHHQGGGRPNMEIHIYIGGVIKMHPSDVHRSTLGSQKSEVRKAMMKRIDFKEGLRGRIMISVPSHFSEPFGTTKSNQKLS
jgi:hypothetical protein